MPAFLSHLPALWLTYCGIQNGGWGGEPCIKMPENRHQLICVSLAHLIQYLAVSEEAEHESLTMYRLTFRARHGGLHITLALGRLEQKDSLS